MIGKRREMDEAVLAQQTRLEPHVDSIVIMMGGICVQHVLAAFRTGRSFYLLTTTTNVDGSSPHKQDITVH